MNSSEKPKKKCKDSDNDISIKDLNLDMKWLRQAISALENVGIEHPVLNIAYDSIEEVQNHIRNLIALNAISSRR